MSHLSISTPHGRFIHHTVINFNRHKIAYPISRLYYKGIGHNNHRCYYCIDDESPLTDFVNGSVLSKKYCRVNSSDTIDEYFTMATFKPYTYLQCPCSEVLSHQLGNDDKFLQSDENLTADERTFDPRAARSNYSLYPLEHLLYCEDCRQIRCPRCVIDEIVLWYCPNCLFEVPSSTVKSEGNRWVPYPVAQKKLL